MQHDAAELQAVVGGERIAMPPQPAGTPENTTGAGLARPQCVVSTDKTLVEQSANQMRTRVFQADGLCTKQHAPIHAC